jgi:haloacetate dehalogenase
MSILDIIPTGEVWARADRRFALAYWHWAFLAQPHPGPERLIEPDPGYFFFQAQFRGVIPSFDPEAYADYVAAAKNPSVIHGMCEDYRAGAGFDRQLDEQDRAAGRQIACPVQVLWGRTGALEAWYDVLDVWRPWAPDLRGQAVDCGHFIPEEKPAETLALLRGFFAESG